MSKKYNKPKITKKERCRTEPVVDWDDDESVKAWNDRHPIVASKAQFIAGLANMKSERSSRCKGTS